ncbi:hypothetical protein TNCV_3651251 [Trichonephila clavipes]|nr:hypothetical protein TNCV_3651251 [Trichonephila clavipes]
MCFCLRKPDEDVDTTLLFPNSVTQGVCRNTYDGHRFCALARLISHTHSEKLIRVSLNTLIHHRAAPTAHARTMASVGFSGQIPGSAIEKEWQHRRQTDKLPPLERWGSRMCRGCIEVETGCFLVVFRPGCFQFLSGLN